MKENILESVNEPNVEVSEDLENADFSVEQRNYSKMSFKKLQKLRVDGVAFGVKIPTLQYDLSKPKKKRKAFIVYGIISSVILALGVIGAAWIIAALLPAFLESAGAMSDATSGNIMSALTLGFTSMFGTAIAALLWLLAIALLAILVSIISYLIYFVRVFFNLSRCSIQEMAIGYEVRNMIFSCIILIVMSAIGTGGIIYLFTIAEQIVMWLILALLAVLVVLLYSISMLVFICIEKKKAKKLFEELPVEEQENFKDHINALGRVKSRIKSIRKSEGQDSWNFY